MIKRMLLFLGALPLGAAPALRASAPQAVPGLPVATFFSAPSLTSLTFSPDGKYIAGARR